MDRNSTFFDVITAEPPTRRATAWVGCSGFFSTTMHDGPAWIGIAEGRIVEITHSRPSVDEGMVDDASLFAAPLLADTHVHT
jgi:hypothetical protein